MVQLAISKLRFNKFLLAPSHNSVSSMKSHYFIYHNSSKENTFDTYWCNSVNGEVKITNVMKRLLQWV